MKRQTSSSPLFRSTRSLALLSAIAGLALSGAACDDSGGTTPTDAATDSAGGGNNTNVTLTIDKATVDFGNVVITKSSAAMTVTVTNSGTEAALPLSSAFNGGDAASFVKGSDTCTGTRLAAGATCSVSFTFSPATTGAKTTSFGLLSGTAGSTNAKAVATTLNGVGVAPAAFSATPIQQSFGAPEVGKSSTQVVTVTNTGGVPSGVPQIVVGGANPTLFAVNAAASTCTAVLAPGASCTLSVVFSPTEVGGFSANVTISAADTASATANFLGTGSPVGTLSIDPLTRNFGSIQVGASSAVSTFTVTNNGTTATENLAVTVGGENPGDYTRTTTCMAALAPKATCTVSVTFTPTAAGSRPAELVVAAANNRVTAGLSGTGVRAALLSLTPAAQLFGSVALGSSGSPITFTVRNTGGVDSSAMTFAKAGANAADFVVSQNNCAGILAGGASCTLQVVFSPPAGGAVGAREATLSVTATTGGTSEASLSGTAIAAGSIQVNPNAWSAGSVALSGMVDQVFTVTNPGQVATSTVTVSIGGANAADFTKLSDSCNGNVIAPGVPCTIALRFRPGAIGDRAASMTIGAATGGTISVPLSGSGLANALLASTPPQQDFGGIVVGLDSAPVVFTVRNNGQVSTGTLVATAIAGPNGQSNNFIVTDNCGGQVLDAGGTDTCQISIFFRPVSEGSKMSTVTVGDGTNTVNINVFGSGLPPAALVVTPSPQSFGTVVIGQSSEAISFQIQNLGGSPTGALDIAPSGGDAAQWTVDRQGCPAQGIASGASCNFTAVFSPTSPAGAKTTSLRVSANNVVFNVTVTGFARRKTVIGSGAAGDPDAIVNTASHNHGNAPSGMRLITDSQNGTNPFRRNFVITCNRSTACGPFTFSLSGANAADFEISAAESGDCGAGTLAAGNSCSKAVQIRPRDLSMAGPQSIAKVAVLNVDSADNEEDLAVNLSGNSINPIFMTWYDGQNNTQADQAYGNVINGTWSNGAAGGFTNVYADYMPTSRPYSYFMTGADQGPFSVIDGGCVGNSVSEDSTCSSTLRFIPSRVGSHSATLNTRLQVVGSYPGNTSLTFNFTDSIGVNGNGTPAPDLQVVNAPTQVSTISGTDSGLVTVTFRNAAGTIASGDVTAVPTPSGVTLANLGGTCNAAVNPLDPGEECTVTFNIDSTPATGVVNNGQVTVTLYHNLNTQSGSVYDEVTAVIPVTITPQLTVTASGPFGSYAGGLTDTRTYTIQNVSSTAITTALSTSLIDLGNCSGFGDGYFAISASTCTPSGLGANSTCVVTVRFSSPDQAQQSDNCTTLRVAHAPSFASVDTAISAVGLGRGVLAFFPSNTGGTRYFGSTALSANSTEQVVRIRNLGAFNTGTLVPTIGGTGSTQFVIDTTTATPAGENRCGTAGFLSLDPNVSCVYILRYFPSAGGTPFDDVATFSVVGAYPGTDTGNMNLQGENVSGTGVTVSPTYTNLDLAVAGTSGNSQVFTITNGTGGVVDIANGGALEIVNAEDGSANTQFAITTENCGATIGVGGFCSATVQYQPDLGEPSGTRHVARLLIAGTATDGTWASLEGRVQAPAAVTISPSGAEGLATVGTPADTVYTLTNSGDIAATVSSITLTGVNASEFSIVANGCSSVPAQGSCNFTVRLLAVSGNYKNVTLTVNTSGGNFSQNLEFLALVQPSLALSPDNATIGGTTPVTGTNSNVQYILVENSIFAGPTLPLTFTLSDNENWNLLVDHDGPSPSCGALRNEDGDILLGGAFFNEELTFGCYVGVQHAPRASGVQANTPQQVTLTATAGALLQTETVNATAKVAVDVVPSSASFCADVNTGTDQRNFTFSLDQGDDTMTERMQTRITGGDADDFGIVFDNCAGEILDSDTFGQSQSQTSCTIGVMFRPQTAGPASANLEVSIITTDGISISRSAALNGVTSNCAN